MSIRFDTNTDILTTTFVTPLTVSTGSLSLGYWILPTTTTNAWRCVQELVNAGTTQIFGTYMQPGSNTINSNSNQGNGGTYNLTNTTWYYITVSRNSGTTIRFRIFDDSASIIPLFDDSVGCTVDYTSLITALFGNGALFDPSPLMEITSFKIYTGAEWSNAESRLESQRFDIQKSGGADRYAWGFESIDADIYGLGERSGGPSFNNTGAINGTYRPAQLELPGSGRRYVRVSPTGQSSARIRNSLINPIVIRNG